MVEEGDGTQPQTRPSLPGAGSDLVRLATTAELEGCRLTLPDPLDPVEAPLAAANERSIDVAGAVLGQALPTLPLSRSAQATDSTTFVAGRSDPSLLAALDPESMVETVLRQLHFQIPGHLRFMRDKVARDLTDVAVHHPGRFPGGRNRLRPAALAAALDEGFTMVLDGVELRDRVSVRLADQFERLFGCSVNINGYMSSRTYTSFGAHWDDQEVVILQLLGRKDWQVQEPVALSPLKSSHGDATSGRIAWEGRIGPGETLYIPRGWGHLVNGIDELTYHYTITVPRTHGLMILESALRERGELRDDPRSGHLVPMTPAGVPVDSPVSGVSELTDAEVDRLVRNSLAARRFAIASRSTQSLSAAVDALRRSDLNGVRVRSPGPGGWVVAGRSGDDILAGLAGSIVAFPAALVGEAAELSDGAVRDAAGFDRDLVQGLVRVGVLEVVTDELLLGSVS